MIRETENDELTGVMEELIETYSEQIGDVAVSLCTSLVREHVMRLVCKHTFVFYVRTSPALHNTKKG